MTRVRGGGIRGPKARVHRDKQLTRGQAKMRGRRRWINACRRAADENENKQKAKSSVEKELLSGD